MSKVMVIGLDGATWDLLKPWAAEGALPTVKKLMENGVWGTLESTIPPVTGPAWTSFSTGKNPGKHGVFDFVKIENNSLRLCQSKDVRSETIWDILSKRGLKSVVIGLPLSFPPSSDFNGVMVSDFLYPRKEIAPKSKTGYIENYRVFPNLLLMGTPADLLDDMVETAKSQVEAAKELFVRETWDFYFFYFFATDGVAHHFWKDMRDTTTRGQAAKGIFHIADEFLHWVLDEMDAEDTLLIMSDHGFADCPFKINLNNIFMEKGLLRTQGRDTSEDATLGKHIVEKFGKRRATALRKSLLSLSSYRRAKHIPRRIFEGLFGGAKADHNARIDFDGSKVFVATSESMSVYVGEMEGAKRAGIVEEIVETLRELEYRGQRVFKEVLLKDGVYSGPFTESSPDILLIPNGFYISSVLGDDVYGEFDKGAWHDLRGVFLAYGSNIKTSSQELSKLKIYDIAPTILHMFGLPIPKDMDGQVLREIFDEKSDLAKRETVYQEAEAKDEKQRIKEKIERLNAHDRI